MTAVAVIGVGRMGGAMARTLTHAGASVVLYNRTVERAASLAREIGARVAASPRAAAEMVDICLSVLADDAAVDQVFDGPDGLLVGARSGGVLVDMSTVTPGHIRRYIGAAHAAGVGLLDAPVSGSVSTALAGELTIMVGGDSADLERARPALEPLAKAIFHLGSLGSGCAMKLAVNTLIFGLNEALAEGVTLAEAAGIERTAAYDVLARSAAGAPFVAYKRAAFLDPEATPTAFALDMAAKDLALITDFAHERGVPMPQTQVNLAVVQAASREGRGSEDFSQVAAHLRRLSATVPSI